MGVPSDKIGFVHHMLYPGYKADEAYHADTAIALSRRADIACFDCCLPVDAGERKRAAQGIRGCGKQITYVNHLFPIKKISMCTADFAEKRIIRDFLEREADAAAGIGADQFLFVSGADVPGDYGDAVSRFKEVTVWLCELLRKHGMTGLIEPLDTCVDKRFLLGSTEKSAEFVESLLPYAPNLALEVDMGHVPLLFETFEDAYARAGRLLGRVHLSNCVVGEPRDSMFGDKHPSFFYPGGHLGKDDLRRVLAALEKIGYMDSPGKLVFEVNPLPGEDPSETIRSHIALIVSVQTSA